MVDVVSGERWERAHLLSERDRTKMASSDGLEEHLRDWLASGAVVSAEADVTTQESRRGFVLIVAWVPRPAPVIGEGKLASSVATSAVKSAMTQSSQ